AELDQNAPSILISGVPSDATLSAGTNNGDGSWSLSAAQLSGLTLTASAEARRVSKAVKATDSQTDTYASTAKTIAITVNQQARAPILSAQVSLMLDEEGAVALNISASAAELDQNAPSILISGVPSDATLSAGTNNGDGSWSLSAAQLSGLTLTA